MKFETLKQNIKKKWIISLVVIIAIVVTISLVGTRAKYRTAESIKIAEGTINYTLGDMNTMAIYLNGDNGYEQAYSIPESGYVLNTTESYCKIGDTKQDVTIGYDFDTKALTITPLTQGKMKCYLYFDVKPPTAAEIILANKTISTRDDFSVVMTEDTTGTIYTAEDDDGTNYYFAGASTDNYVYFAGFYWRIIRINGDGTIRLIYDGTSAISNGTSSSATQTGTSKFNSSYSNNMYVGFMYTSGSVHGTGTTSTILTTLNTWYTNNLSSYASYIDSDAGFCNDRTPYTSNAGTTSGGGTGTTATYYGAYIRLYKSNSVSNAAPSLKCPDSSDLFTVSTSSKGNKALTNPIGLITADEVAFAGGVVGKTNQNYYLYTGQYYWTLSPSGFSISDAIVWRVTSTGALDRMEVSTSYGVRPVINLKADTEFADGGTGTAENPYVV